MLAGPGQPWEGQECRSCGQVLTLIEHQRLFCVADVVFQEGRSHGHAHLVPAVAFIVDGLDGADGPAGQVPVEGGRGSG